MEEFRPVPNYEGLYEVSNQGRVKSLRRTVRKKDGRKLNLKRKILRPSQSRGKLQVILSKNNKHTSHKVHTLVLLAFHGECPNKGEQAIWKNGNRQDNRADNLMWGRPSPSAEHIENKKKKLLAELSKLPPEQIFGPLKEVA
jgi:hypothetical protein